MIAVAFYIAELPKAMAGYNTVVWEVYLGYYILRMILKQWKIEI